MQKRAPWSRRTAAQALTGRPRGFPATGRTPLLGAGSPARPGGAVVTGSDGAAHGTRTPGFCETRILVRAPRSCLGRTPGSGVSPLREKRGGEDGAMCSENHLQRRQPSTGCWHPASVGTGRGPGRRGDLPSVCLAGPVCVQDCGLRGPSGLRPPGRALADGRGHGACAPRSLSPRWLPVDRRSSPQPWSLP